MNNLAFSAQSLDNQTPDTLVDNERPLIEENERRELVEKISEVALDGTQVFSEDSHNAFLYHDKFLLEAPPDELDDAGRISPLLCYGHVPDEPPASWSEDVVSATIGFANRIGRKISDESQDMARRGVEAILAERKKQLRMRRKMLGVAALLIVLGVLSILWVIFVKK
ncbi:MAG: hypothetical protein OXH16_13130 [Gemmatimonadetes bacterium]|nr:hypothetical protein [Gemmatimonadota bacterium]